MMLVQEIIMLHGLFQCSALKGHSFYNLMDLCIAMIYRTTVWIIPTFHQVLNVGEFLYFLKSSVYKQEYFFQNLQPQ